MKKIILYFLICLLFINCGISIRNIKESPSRYKNRNLIFKSKVVEKISIPFIKINLYKIFDSTDIIFLISDKTYEINENIKVEGKLIRIDKEDTAKKLYVFSDLIGVYLMNKGYLNKTTKELVKPITNFLYKISKKVKITFFLLAK